MGVFKPKTKTEIKDRYISRVKYRTGLNDVLDGSVINTLADTHAGEIADQQYQVKQIIDLDNLDNVYGDDLEVKADAYNLEREPTQSATGKVEVIDTSITKRSAKTSSGGANVGEMTLSVGNIVGTWPTSGYILIGERTEPEFEEIYFTNFVGGIFTLQTQITKDHGADEPVVLKTVGERTFAGSESVVTEETQTQEKVKYTINGAYTIYDGEDRAYDVPVVCDEAGTVGNIPSEAIGDFASTKPFQDADVTNPVSITNGRDEETDEHLRGRIRNVPFTLTKGVRTAVEESALKATFEDRQVKFVQPFESLDNTEPSLLYIDDGSGFVPTEAIILEEIIQANAVGGEYNFLLSGQPRLKELAATNSKTLNLYKNGTTLLVEGTDYKLNFHDGTIKLDTPLVIGESIQAGNTSLSVNGYVKYTGLLQEAQWQVDGKRDDQENYPGGKAYGAHITIVVPSIQDIDVDMEIFTEDGVSKESVRLTIIQNISEYVNNVGIGKIILLDQLRHSVLKITGVKKVVFTVPTDDVSIGIGILPKIQSSNIVIV